MVIVAVVDRDSVDIKTISSGSKFVPIFLISGDGSVFTLYIVVFLLCVFLLPSSFSPASAS